jgi:hypothetical protein
MGNNHKQTKTRANAIVTAWGSLAKDDLFAGYTLAQFQQLQADAQGKSDALKSLDAGYTDAMMQRDAAHDTLNTAMLNVVDGVKGNTAKYGANSSLYKAMGYVPRDERASGLTRKASTTVSTGGTTTGTAKATASPVATVPTATTSGSVKN